MKNKLTLKTLASWWGAKWREAVPSGNGVIGAAVYGAVGPDRLYLIVQDATHENMPELLKQFPQSN